ncbi:hypothetical protein P6144_16880 [Sphingomonas sp. HITSZ_GF]|uniref:hypothetical protein n=1 Tax=Sphingomonas sp. HITSZ_GF TaxID=3037247 RepID=UPI00240E1D58|nr:hypothetical protein [Sphingomonas sp. HITSZ_GF]MDG2535338.1 hypothetical protein [Sphingomonas sp. HITSZ_GF]
MHAVLLLLALAGCHGAQQVGVDMAFDVDDDGGRSSAKCIASSGGACQIEFRGAGAVRTTLQPGEMRSFAQVRPGTVVCIAAELADLARCEPVTLAAGYARIRKGRYNRVG